MPTEKLTSAENIRLFGENGLVVKVDGKEILVNIDRYYGMRESKCHFPYFPWCLNLFGFGAGCRVPLEYGGALNTVSSEVVCSILLPASLSLR